MSPSLLRKCRDCGVYTLSQTVCPKCGGTIYSPIPPKFSVEDKYGKYRRAMKKIAQKQAAESSA
ncbi:RNA-protein complex protein Nop10 [Candidatus Hecatella orcuttiae]|uniref:RNA-protein complex protein Nop10 n=1 Tax=Candidatus Hecatella orcuttiae TaxID=1935119 RepID=UPI002867E530|nr:RNA-protein complex protein Nop10 [Candidatus Hecatella orcuttiae]